MYCRVRLIRAVDVVCAMVELGGLWLIVEVIRVCDREPLSKRGERGVEIEGELENPRTHKGSIFPQSA